MIWPRAFSTMIFSSTGPGGAVNDALAPEDAADASAAGGGAVVVPGVVVTGGVVPVVAPGDVASGTRPRKIGRPSAAVAVSCTRAAVSLARAPSCTGSGSHTNVTRVCPSGA